MSQTSLPAHDAVAKGGEIGQFLRNYYIYFVLVAVAIVLSVANID